MADKTSQKAGVSIKHGIVDKANTTMIAAGAGAVFVVIFCGFAVSALISQSSFQREVIGEKRKALDILEENKKEADALEASYVAFESEQINVLGGNREGDGPKDGDNAKLVLDALPSEYDYAALASSIEKILLDGGYQIQSIGGSEDASQSTNSVDDVVVSGSPEAQEIPYPFSIETSPEGTLRLLEILESSIRPFYVDSLNLQGQGNNLSVRIDLKTFYQPATGLQISTKEVRK